MDKKTKALIGFTIGALIGTAYSTYELYKYVDEIETQNVKLKHDLWDSNFNNMQTESYYRTLYYYLSNEEKEKFRSLFPFRIPSFIDE